MANRISNSPGYDDFSFEDDILGDINSYLPSDSKKSQKSVNTSAKRKSSSQTRSTPRKHTSIAQASKEINNTSQATTQPSRHNNHSSHSKHRSVQESSPHVRQSRDTTQRTSRDMSFDEEPNVEDYLNDDFDNEFEQENSLSQGNVSSHSQPRSFERRSHSIREVATSRVPNQSNADDSFEDGEESTEEIDSPNPSRSVVSPTEHASKREISKHTSAAEQQQPETDLGPDLAEQSVESTAMSGKETKQSFQQDESNDSKQSAPRQKLTLQKGTGDISRDEMIRIQNSFEDITFRSFILVIEHSKPVQDGNREPRVQARLLTKGTLAECFSPRCFSYDSWEWYVDASTKDFYFEGVDKKRGKLFCQYRRVNKATTVEQLKKLMDKINNNNPHEISLSARTSDIGTTILKYFV